MDGRTLKMVREGNEKSLERRPAMSSADYCPMTGSSETTQYLEPVSDWPDGAGYLPMGPPPPSYATPNQPYANTTTENSEPTIDMASEPDCGMMGYDVPPPMHVYSEIPGNNYDDDDDDEDHIYESLDQAKPPPTQ